MKADDREQFSMIWLAAWDACGKQIGAVGVKLAFEALKRYDLGDIERALMKHMTDPDTGQFPPKPADIVKHIDGTTKGNAEEAWGKVMKGLERGGPYVKLAFDDPAIHAALETVGWAALCQMTYEQLAFRKKDFEAAYKGAIGTNTYPAYVCAVPTPGAKVLYIGDEAEAESVLMLGNEPKRLH